MAGFGRRGEEESALSRPQGDGKADEAGRDLGDAVIWNAIVEERACGEEPYRRGEGARCSAEQRGKRGRRGGSAWGGGWGSSGTFHAEIEAGMARGDGDAGGVGPSMRGDGDARGVGGAESGGGSSTRRPSFLGAAERGWRARMAISTRRPSFLGAAERGWRAEMAMRAGSDLLCAGHDALPSLEQQSWDGARGWRCGQGRTFHARGVGGAGSGRLQAEPCTKMGVYVYTIIL
jgi:hypothetical protein